MTHFNMTIQVRISHIHLNYHNHEAFYKGLKNGDKMVIILFKLFQKAACWSLQDDDSFMMLVTFSMCRIGHQKGFQSVIKTEKSLPI